MPKKNKDIMLSETTKTIQSHKDEFNKEIETLKRIQAEMKRELEKPKSPTRKLKAKITCGMDQTEGRISIPKDKVEDLDQIIKEN